MSFLLCALALLSSASSAAAAERTPPREGGGLFFPPVLVESPRVEAAGALIPALPRDPALGIAAPAVEAAPATPTLIDVTPAMQRVQPVSEPSLAQPAALPEPNGAGPEPEENSAATIEPGVFFDGRRPEAQADPISSGRDVSGEYHSVRAALKAEPGHARPAASFSRSDKELADLKHYKVLFVPGFLSGAFIKLSQALGSDPQPWHYFGPQTRWLERLGVEHEIVGVHTEQTAEHNARIIAQAIKTSSKPVLIISHSKGGLDTLQALLGLEAKDLAKVAGWLPVQSPFLGSPGADRVTGHPAVRFWVSRFLEHPYVGGCARSLTRMTTETAERFYFEKRKDIARILRAVPTVAFTSWKEAGILGVLRELTNLGLALNPFLHPGLFLSPLLGLAIIAKAAGETLAWLSTKSDGLVPAARARVPEMDFVEQEGVDHFVPFVDHGGPFDRLEFTQALLKMLLKRVKARAR